MLSPRFDRRLSRLQDWQGRVAQVFEHSALLRSNTSGEDERAITIQFDEQRGLVPYGLLLKDLDFDLREGQKVELTAGVLSLPAADEKGRAVEIELDGEAINLRLPEGGDLDKKIWRAQLSSLSKIKIPHVAGQIEEKIQDKCQAGLHELLGLITDGVTSTRLFRETLGQLHGLGAGLTPSGDDLLVGVLASARWLASSGALAAAGVQTFSKALTNMSMASTTVVAYEMLQQAAAGYFIEELLDFVTLLGDTQGPSRRLTAAARRLISVGGQSGAEMFMAALKMSAAALNSPVHLTQGANRV